MQISHADHALAEGFAGSQPFEVAVDREPAQTVAASHSFDAVDAAIDAGAERVEVERQAQFVIGGQRYSLSAMLAANADDPAFSDWAESAKPGDVYEQMHSERCECVGDLEARRIAADVANNVDKGARKQRANEERAFKLQTGQGSSIRGGW